MVSFTPPVPTEQVRSAACMEAVVMTDSLTADGLGKHFLCCPTCGLFTIPAELSRKYLDYYTLIITIIIATKALPVQPVFLQHMSFLPCHSAQQRCGTEYHPPGQPVTATVLRYTIKWTLCTTDFRTDQYVVSSELFYCRLFVCSPFHGVSFHSNY